MAFTIYFQQLFHLSQTIDSYRNIDAINSLFSATLELASRHTGIYKSFLCFFSFQNDQIQLVVLLERLLERVTLATATLTQLDNCYSFSSKNAEVRVIIVRQIFVLFIKPYIEVHTFRKLFS